MSVMNRANVNRQLGGRRASGGRFITGIVELDEKLAMLKTSGANKIARPAIAKAARFLLKKMKAAVPPQYKESKKWLGQVVDSKGPGRAPRAKVGAGVGITAKKKEGIKPKERGNRPGVGMGINNLHWFILGADGSSPRGGGPPRSHKTTGKSTGEMKPLMPDLVKGTTAQAKMEMMRIIRDEVSLRLAILANSGK